MTTPETTAPETASPNATTLVTTPDAPADTPARKARTVKQPDSKQALLVQMLKRKRGATLDELVEATGWQAHSVRGAISGTLRKKRGLAVTLEALGGRGKVYRIVAAEA